MDSHIPSPLVIFCCTVLCHALLQWQKNTGVHPKASKSRFEVEKQDGSNNFNYRIDSRRNGAHCASTGCRFLTQPGVAAIYTFLTCTWNTLPEHYQQSVSKKTLPTVKRQIQQLESPLPAVGNSIEAARIWQSYSSWLFDTQKCRMRSLRLDILT
jgi:hypothetical protein